MTHDSSRPPGVGPRGTPDTSPRRRGFVDLFARVPPAACSSGPDRIEVLAVGQTGKLLHTVWDGSGWSGFESLGVPALQCGDTQRSVPLSGPLAVCAGGDHRIAVFVPGTRGDLIMKWWDGTAWSEFVSLGWPETPDEIYPAIMLAAPLTGPPAACSWGPDRGLLVGPEPPRCLHSRGRREPVSRLVGRKLDP